MKTGSTLAVIALAFTVAPNPGQVPEDFKRRFEQAERQIVRLPPSAFPNLPPKVIADLQRRGCTIPQEANAKQPDNVIQGAFGAPGRKDWAVVCSVKGTSSILIFWNGSVSNPATIASAEDRHFLQTIGGDKIGFSREITPAGKEFILRHYEAYGGPKPPPLDHQGIDDAFVGKASVTWYFHNGKWVGLQGAD